MFTCFIILGSILNVDFRNGFNLILTISISIFKVVKHLLVALDPKLTTHYKKNMVRSSNIHPFQSNVVFHTETSHLICSANQLTGFYMMRTLVVKGLSSHHLLVQCVKSVQSWHTAQKLKFPLRISLVNVTKSVGNCAFGHIYWRNPNGKLHFLCSDSKDVNVVLMPLMPIVD